MNKYTLIFNDPILESLYQTNHLNSIVYPISILMNIQGILFMTCTLAWRIGHGNFNYLAINLAALCWFIITMCVVRKKKQWTQYSLFILNHIFMSFQLTIEPDSDPNLAYILSSCLMMAQCIILLVCDFKLACFNNLTLFAFRFGTSLMYYNLEFYYYLLLTLMSLNILFFLYKVNFNTRAYYLSTLKDSQWDTLLPKVVQNEFYLFHWNKDLVKFELQLSNTATCIDRQNSFYELIRNYQVQNGDTLENSFLRGLLIRLRIVHLCNKNHSKSYQIIMDRKFYLSEMNFLIVLECKKVNQVILQSKQVNKSQLQNFSHFIKQTAKTLQKYTLEQDFNKISTLQLIFFEFQARLRLQTITFRVERILLSAVIEKCKPYFKKLQIILDTQSAEITTFKPLFILMLLHMLKSVQGKTLYIQTNQYDLELIIFYAKFDKKILLNDVVFQKALQTLVVDYEEIQNGYRFKLETNFSFSGIQQIEQFI